VSSSHEFGAKLKKIHELCTNYEQKVVSLSPKYGNLVAVAA
jgi:hypothetical protein